MPARAPGGLGHPTRANPVVNLLLVDDDPHALSYLSGLLRDAHRVTTCVDGAEALSRLRPRTFDLVLTDLRMPGPDGFEILRAAQALEPPIPVVVLTAVDSARPAVDALRLGARDFLVKPPRRTRDWSGAPRRSVSCAVSFPHWRRAARRC
ncbi:MAG: response regulator [Candidatus Eisenbacteria bacterium]|uniref:Response regulator n=1 Tax=Eiseniibacteriota bacterium TaxID=2212470 RepID=A0A538U8Z9_UNCEI|nr:MAG: response regulator [Candidatus Eisenbacteria bacterium]